MTKLKTPLLSFSASGSIAKQVSFQKRGNLTLARTRPVPTDRKTLPQIYHRWLYQDYASLWHTLSAAQKQTWETNARPYHITGFNLWMRTKLNTLPDIVGMWRLDSVSGGLTPDSSKNANTGTVVGPSLAAGVIDGGLFFDGINDRIDVPNSPSLQITGDLTIEAFGRIDGWETTNQIVYKSDRWEYEFYIVRDVPNIWLVFRHGDGAAEGLYSATVSLDLGVNYHFAVTRTAVPKQVHFYLNGAFVSTSAYTKTPLASNFQVRLGFRSAPSLWNGMLDQLLIYNRAESAAEIRRHSLRRYPQ